MIRALVKDPVKRGQAVGFVLGFAVCFLVRPVPVRPRFRVWGL